ncbi:MAG: DEDD exonuclease domain-containing protein [Cellulomonas sp.]|nr:DEDD exonuclease domain-containing protein [Cellulomonas sp.]
MREAQRLRPVWAGTPPPSAGARAVQPSLSDIGTPLHEVTFVVVDLETTGGRAADCEITEIGAVKVRGGQVLGELATLVDPGAPVPPAITVLTGITTAMLVGAPRIEAVLPSFLEFAQGAVLVAHNAPFDIGFLKAACARTGRPWPGNQVVDTVRLARRVVTRDEAPNHRLSTLAGLFRTSVAPSHRALDDARATVDVLHALLGRLAPLGVTHLEDLASAADPVPADVRRRRHLADGLPDAPGVYLFRGPQDEVLYVGTSTTSLRSRVRSYFTAAETRSRMVEMVRLATRVDPVVCATALEARVRELRLIAEHAPRYNRRSRAPEAMPWVRITEEPYPRLSVVRQVTAGATHIGPFSSAGAARLATEAVHEAFEIRRCTRRLPLVPDPESQACVLAELGRCPAPCLHGDPDGTYVGVVDRVRDALTGDPVPVVRAHAQRLAELTDQQRFEDAAMVRDRLAAFLRAAGRAQRFDPMARLPELVAAHREPDGGWELVLVRFGRLAGTARTRRDEDPLPVVAALRATGEHVAAPVPPATAAHPEETDLILQWLARPGVRLVEVEGTFAWPVRSAASDDDPVTALGALPAPALLSPDLTTADGGSTAPLVTA